MATKEQERKPIKKFTNNHKQPKSHASYGLKFE
jgi:hypothetical protein